MNERFDDGRFRKPRGALARFRHPDHYTARTATPQTPLPTYRIRGQPWRSVGSHDSWVGESATRDTKWFGFAEGKPRGCRNRDGVRKSAAAHS